MTTRRDVVAEARAWLHTPYQHQQRMRGVAVDCAGLIIGVARALALVPPEFDITGYPRRPDGVSLLAHCDRFMVRIRRGEPGDVIVIRWEHDPQHLAILSDYRHGGLSIIHALGTADGNGRVIEQRLHESMRSRIVQAYSLPGVG